MDNKTALLKLVKEVREATSTEQNVEYLETLASKVEEVAGAKRVVEKMSAVDFLECWLATIDDMLEEERLNAAGMLLNKPPSQIAGVRGIDATRFSADNPPPINRHRLAGLPPFQMFAAEKRQLPATLVLQDDAVQEYMEWHKAKGCWPNETPFGEVVP